MFVNFGFFGNFVGLADAKKWNKDIERKKGIGIYLFKEKILQAKIRQLFVNLYSCGSRRKMPL